MNFAFAAAAAGNAAFPLPPLPAEAAAGLADDVRAEFELEVELPHALNASAATHRQDVASSRPGATSKLIFLSALMSTTLFDRERPGGVWLRAL
jgi:hypothetical protein